MSINTDKITQYSVGSYFRLEDWSVYKVNNLGFQLLDWNEGNNMMYQVPAVKDDDIIEIHGTKYRATKHNLVQVGNYNTNTNTNVQQKVVPKYTLPPTSKSIIPAKQMNNSIQQNNALQATHTLSQSNGQSYVPNNITYYNSYEAPKVPSTVYNHYYYYDCRGNNNEPMLNGNKFDVFPDQYQYQNNPANPNYFNKQTTKPASFQTKKVNGSDIITSLIIEKLKTMSLAEQLKFLGKGEEIKETDQSNDEEYDETEDNVETEDDDDVNIDNDDININNNNNKTVKFAPTTSQSKVNNRYDNLINSDDENSNKVNNKTNVAGNSLNPDKFINSNNVSTISAANYPTIIDTKL